MVIAYHHKSSYYNLLCYLDIKYIYIAATFTQKVKMEEQLWILAVSKYLDAIMMKRVR